MVSLQLDAHSRRRSWVLTGLIMGVLAGIIFAMFEMLMAAILGQGFFMPLRMIGAIVLGQRALDPAYFLAVAGLVGLVVHMILSGLYGMVFGAVAGSIPFVRASRFAVILAASIFGLLLWLVNFFLIAPLAFPWFGMANPLVQVVAHIFFYGTALGLLLATRRAGRAVRTVR